MATTQSRVGESHDYFADGEPIHEMAAHDFSHTQRVPTVLQDQIVPNEFQLDFKRSSRDLLAGPNVSSADGCQVESRVANRKRVAVLIPNAFQLSDPIVVVWLIVLQIEAHSEIVARNRMHALTPVKVNRFNFFFKQRCLVLLAFNLSLPDLIGIARIETGDLRYNLNIPIESCCVSHDVEETCENTS